MQTLYALIALLLVMLLGLSFYQSRNRTQETMIANEVLTPVNAFAMDLLDRIGRQAFDAVTDESKVAAPIWPMITDVNNLTPSSNFGGCTDFATCEDIDDFDGLTVDRTIRGLPYSADIVVEYVQEAAPDQPTGGTPSWAKRVTITVSTTALKVGGQPLTVNMDRVFTYDRITSIP